MTDQAWSGPTPSRAQTSGIQWLGIRDASCSIHGRRACDRGRATETVWISGHVARLSMCHRPALKRDIPKTF